MLERQLYHGSVCDEYVQRKRRCGARSGRGGFPHGYEVRGLPSPSSFGVISLFCVFLTSPFFSFSPVEITQWDMICTSTKLWMDQSLSLNTKAMVITFFSSSFVPLPF